VFDPKAKSQVPVLLLVTDFYLERDLFSTFVYFFLTSQVPLSDLVSTIFISSLNLYAALPSLLPCYRLLHQCHRNHRLLLPLTISPKYLYALNTSARALFHRPRLQEAQDRACLRCMSPQEDKVRRTKHSREHLHKLHTESQNVLICVSTRSPCYPFTSAEFTPVRLRSPEGPPKRESLCPTHIIRSSNPTNPCCTAISPVWRIGWRKWRHC
jgi:hypothetical protein